MDNHTILQSKLVHVWHTYIFAQEVYYYTEYLHNPQTNAEKEVLISDFPGGDIRFILHIMFRSVIIEVCKLYKESIKEKSTLASLLNSVSGTAVSDTFIAESQNAIRDNKNVIDYMFLLRDKAYAHSDNTFIDFNKINITFNQIKQLLDLAYGIIRHIGEVLFETHYVNDTIRFDRNRFILLDLIAKADNKRRDDLLLEFQNSIAACQKLNSK